MTLSDLLLIAVGLLVIVLSGMISRAINEFDEYFLIRGQSYVPPDWLIRIIDDYWWCFPTSRSSTVSERLARLSPSA